MTRLLSCIGYEHNLYLVALAAIICLAGGIVSARLFQRTRSSRGLAGAAWMFLGAISAGSTIWCTHFVAMLAYETATNVRYDPGLTALSLAVALAGSVVAFGIGREHDRFAPAIGGAVFGLATAAMHYVGMMAFGVNGTIHWDIGYVVASVLVGLVLGALSFHVLARATKLSGAATGAMLMVLSIVGLHFLGMTAMTIDLLLMDPGAVDASAEKNIIAAAVAAIGLIVLGTGIASYLVDKELVSQTSAKLRHLTESAVDGMGVLQHGKMVHVNAALETMTGMSHKELIGSDLSEVLGMQVEPRDGELKNLRLRRKDGSEIPVELVTHIQKEKADSEPLTVVSLRDISQRIAQEKKISFLARFDSLTHLHNRASFIEELSDILEGGEDRSKFAVLAIDLDRFKEINDSHGHAAGDQVLRIIGKRLRSTLRKSEVAGRFGGDEFAIFAKIADRADAGVLAERITQIIEKPVSFDQSILSVGASIGVALYPDHGDDIRKLLNSADLAMYRAKAARMGVCLYEEGMGDDVRERRRMTEELREGIRRDQLELHYQAQIDLSGELTCGYEALVRWNHPERGLLMPDEFIDLAEQTGLIVKLGEWVLQRACDEAAEWEEPRTISVNISPVQLADPGLVDFVAETLHSTGLKPERLELEVTETCFIRDPLSAIETLGNLKQLGIAISIDDFGTGYSSLAMLQDFPFDKIKLDKSLIDRIESSSKSQGVFRALMSLGEALNVPVLAEGVETTSQRDYLRQMGCRHVQGFLYGRPQPQVQESRSRSEGALVSRRRDRVA